MIHTYKKSRLKISTLASILLGTISSGFCMEETPPSIELQKVQQTIPHSYYVIDSPIYRTLPLDQKNHIVHKALNFDSLESASSFFDSLILSKSSVSTTSPLTFDPLSPKQLLQFIDELRADIKEKKREQGGWAPFIWGFTFSGNEFPPALKKLKELKKSVEKKRCLESDNKMSDFSKLKRSSLTEKMSDLQIVDLLETMNKTSAKDLSSLPSQVISALLSEPINSWEIVKQDEINFISTKIMELLLKQAYEGIYEKTAQSNNHTSISKEDHLITFHRIALFNEKDVAGFNLIQIIDKLLNENSLNCRSIKMTWNKNYQFSIVGDYFSYSDFEKIHTEIHAKKRNALMAEDDFVFLELYFNDIMNYRMKNIPNDKLFYDYFPIMKKLRIENKGIIDQLTENK